MSLVYDTTSQSGAFSLKQHLYYAGHYHKKTNLTPACPHNNHAKVLTQYLSVELTSLVLSIITLFNGA